MCVTLKKNGCTLQIKTQEYVTLTFIQLPTPPYCTVSQCESVKFWELVERGP